MSTLEESSNNTFGYVLQDSSKLPPCPHDALFVVPNFKLQMGGGKVSPFASILALSPAEVIAAKPRRCIYAFKHKDGTYEYSDGVLAVKDKCFHLSHGIVWPELWRALRREPKAWSKLFHQKGSMQPYILIKNWHEDDVPLDVADPSDSPCIALMILKAWNDWENKKLSWIDRLVSLANSRMKTDPGAARILNTPSHQAAEANKLEKYCKKLGLKLKTKTVFDKPFYELSSLLDIALKIEES